MNTAVLREHLALQTTAVSPAVPPTDTGGGVSVQELVDGLLNADADADANAGESRAERSVLANSAGSRGAQSGQGQPGTGVPAPGTPASQLTSSPAAMAATQGGGTLEQSMMQAQVGQQIMLMHERGISSARIRLDPPELGSLIIKLEVQDRSAVVHFSAQHQMVRDSLEQQLPRLQEMMDDMGLELSDASVDSQAGGREETEQHDESGAARQGGDIQDSDDHLSDKAEETSATAGVLSLVDQYV
jgi:flagellar hook-length control protein FliK